ncbi:hypothetical protein [Diaminobutyricimonas sp. LJ205]|nr:hypothetical protein [Diaminobutyricimonas sp. LJ205]
MVSSNKTPRWARPSWLGIPTSVWWVISGQAALTIGAMIAMAALIR